MFVIENLKTRKSRRKIKITCGSQNSTMNLVSSMLFQRPSGALVLPWRCTMNSPEGKGEGVFPPDHESLPEFYFNFIWGGEGGGRVATKTTRKAEIHQPAPQSGQF